MSFIVGVVLVALVGAAYAIWQYGPGVREHYVRCPLLNKLAKVLVDQREADFYCSYAGLKAVDLTHCSFMNGPLGFKCRKECLRNL
jgi:hypothetical protein